VLGAEIYDLSGVAAQLRTNRVTKLPGDVTAVSSNCIVVVHKFPRYEVAKPNPGDPVRIGNFLGSGSPKPNPKYSAHYTVMNYPRLKEASVGDRVEFHVIAIPLGNEVRKLAYYVPPPKEGKTLK
jgi:hypothetical protein